MKTINENKFFAFNPYWLKINYKARLFIEPKYLRLKQLFNKYKYEYLKFRYNVKIKTNGRPKLLDD